MSNRDREMQEILVGRKPITPEDLPPFGARVTIHNGAVGEILGWYGPNGGSNSIDRQRLALTGVIEAVNVPAELEQGRMAIGYIFEDWIVRSETQRFPKFATWIREVAVSSMIGRQWRENSEPPTQGGESTC